MIFITVGSQKFQFNRLIKSVDLLVDNGFITEDVFAQIGACTYKPKNFSYTEFLSREEFDYMLNKCTLVITHGGTGIIVNALKLKKPVVAMPRLAKYNEHVDNHQVQLIEQFTNSKLISSCLDENLLDDAINIAKSLQHVEYHSNTERYISEISSYIDSL